MLEMSERESSDVWHSQQPAHKAPGRVEAKEPRSIQQKVGIPATVGRSQKGLTVSNSGMLTGGLTTFSRIPVLAEFRCYAIGHRAAVQKTERHVNQLLHSGAGDLTANNDHAVAEYHTVMLEIPVYHAVAECSERERQTLCSVYEWTDIFQPKGQW